MGIHSFSTLYSLFLTSLGASGAGVVETRSPLVENFTSHALRSCSLVLTLRFRWPQPAFHGKHNLKSESPPIWTKRVSNPQDPRAGRSNPIRMTQSTVLRSLSTMLNVAQIPTMASNVRIRSRNTHHP